MAPYLWPRSRPVTRSWTRAKMSLPTCSSSAGHRTLDSNYLVQGNMLQKETLERELISALCSNKPIPIPTVEIMKDEEYDQLYPVVFADGMPCDMIAIGKPARPGPERESKVLKMLKEHVKTYGIVKVHLKRLDPTKIKTKLFGKSITVRNVKLPSMPKPRRTSQRLKLKQKF